MAMKRPYGGERPYINGDVWVRIPFIHCNPTFPEAIQGMCMAYCVLAQYPRSCFVQGE